MATEQTNNCEALDLYQSLNYCPGDTVLPGLRKTAYAVSKRQVAKFAKLPELAVKLQMDKISVLEGQFEMFADVVAIRIDLLDTASNITSQSQGEKPSKTFVNTATIKYPGNNEAATGFCRLANADDMIFFVQQRDGKWRVIGNKMFDTNINPSQESGMAVTDASGTTLEITSTDLCPAPFYKGLLHTVDGWLNCETDEITEEKPAGAA